MQESSFLPYNKLKQTQFTAPTEIKIFDVSGYECIKPISFKELERLYFAQLLKTMTISDVVRVSNLAAATVYRKIREYGLKVQHKHTVKKNT